MDAGISFERSPFSESLMGKADKPCVMSYAFRPIPGGQRSRTLHSRQVFADFLPLK